MQNLRIGRNGVCKLGKLLSAPADDLQELDCRKLTVSGGGIIKKNEVSRLLTAKAEAAELHHLKHVPIAHVGAF